ncbi:hypothetical protein W911_16875 [Hyphomicrobium nitrativorans NL23]|uniref:Uncharacterized protein n=2 Tax=Hyphomicrobium TaxID=81 RepID=V5SK02_9HYPH|nr:hypothetical protein W911_16875 [Hyphomicrobium nitrativorans NL23]
MRPGIFHDPEKDVVLFAHPYLRRSLSRLNVLNNDLLTRLAALAESELSVTLRLRLDPDIVGYPDTRAALELEFWRGPKFTDDIGKIPAGVTEHKASDRLKEFEGIDRTQFWWKTEDEHKRTFEAEEIRDTPSLGVSNDYYGCRYMHSEFGTREETITHFDGAIRGYDTEAFVTRIDQSIDRAGKRADYTKLFRVDGGLTVELWKELVSDYFRGNTLVPEYFGSPPQRDETNRAQPRAAPVSETTGQLMIGYLDRTAITASDCTALISFDLVAQDDGPAQFRVFEALPPGIAEAFSSFSEYTNGAQIEYGDRLANLPVLVFGQANEATQEFSHWCACIPRVLSKERENLDLAAAAFMWPRERYWVMLSLCGDIVWLIDALGQLPTVVRTQEPPSVWVQDLKAKLASGAQSNGKIADIDDVRWPGFLKLRRTQSTASFRVPSGHPAFDFLNKKAAGPSGGDREPRTEG